MYCITLYSISYMFAIFVRLSGVISIKVWSQSLSNMTAVKLSVFSLIALLEVSLFLNPLLV